MAESSEIDEIPPLEDMSDLLEKVEALKTKGQSSLVCPTPVASMKKDVTEIVNSKSPPVGAGEKEKNIKKAEKQKSNSSQSFGGMKKGFLFSSSSNQKKSKPVNAKEQCDLPYIKPQENKNSQLNISEVQDAMKASENIFQNRDWVTDDLMKKIENNKTIYSKLSNPEFATAIAEFQSNPQAAMMKYANNSEMQNFLKEFCGVMGEHFTSLSNEQGDSTGHPSASNIQIKNSIQDNELKPANNSKPLSVEDDEKLQKILSSPQIKEVLMDEQIQRIISILKNNPRAGERLLKEANGELKKKLKILIDAELLQIEQR